MIKKQDDQEAERTGNVKNVESIELPPKLLSAETRGVILVGDYGSGKTEIAVNLALNLARSLDPNEKDRQVEEDRQDKKDRKVAIADLDLVNPYFRCREAIEPLEQAGVRVVVPQGGHRFADLPILLPQVKGLLQSDDEVAVLDVGGDEVGSRVLAGLAPAFRLDVHELWFVINANRPFNDTPEGCLRTIQRIERVCSLRVSGLVSNTHLMQETTAQMVMQGAAMSEVVSKMLALPLRAVAVMAQISDQVSVDHPVLRMRRLMVPPWLRRDVMSNKRTGPDMFRLHSA